ncbi:redox-regulated ATPase YchF [Candidatus Saccharibacteria bacterium]|nr:redox-regulated ATPase YchF [Candidatus Saccharibacteria bacterium]
MSLSIGIIGLPNVGKSTLFNALTDANALIANYPFATIEPNTGIVPIPDSRLQKLAEIYKTEKIVPATVTFVDIAGLVAGASQGEGLGNQFLSHIRQANAICHVVRAFDDPNVARVKNPDASIGAPTSDLVVGASEDIEIINTELVLADLQTVDKRLPRLEKETKANPKLKPQLDALNSINTHLQTNSSLSHSNILKNIRMDKDQSVFLDELQLLTAKPVIYVFNIDEASLQGQSLQKELTDLIAPAKAVFICAKLESELRGLDETDRQELLASYGQNESGLIQLIHAAYGVLGLQSFLTAGEKEVRAWTISKGSTAPQAAGVIHSDFQRGFIAAQVINYQDLITAGSVAGARAAGKVRTEGKDYIMQPDDVVEFRFNV